MHLPVGEKAGDYAQFLTPAEFALLLDQLPEQFKVFVQFLVMTGTRFGEATAVTIDDLELQSHPATVRISVAWKRDGNNTYYVGPTKTGAGKGTVSLPPSLVEQVAPVTAGRRVSELCTAPSGRKPGFPPLPPPTTRAWPRPRGSTICAIRTCPGQFTKASPCSPFRAGSATPPRARQSKSMDTSCPKPSKRPPTPWSVPNDACANNETPEKTRNP